MRFLCPYWLRRLWNKVPVTDHTASSVLFSNRPAFTMKDKYFLTDEEREALFGMTPKQKKIFLKTRLAIQMGAKISAAEYRRKFEEAG